MCRFKNRSQLSLLFARKQLFFYIAAFCLALVPGVTSAPVFGQSPTPVTFERVVELLELEVREEKLIALINSQPTVFTLSDEQLARLKKAGASEAVIAAMIPKGNAVVESDITAYVMILDASGSMLESAGDGKTKWSVAKQAATDLIMGIPEGLAMSVVIYGHDKARACEVDVLRPLLPLTKADRSSLIQRINSIEPVGKTPIASSLRLAASLMNQSRGMSKLLLITDGLETCNGDPVAEAKAFASSVPTGRSIDVIGFALPSDESTAISRIAVDGKGKYFDARTSNDLVKAFDQVKQDLAQKLAVTDGAIKLTASKDPNVATELPVGRYTSARLGPNNSHYWLVRFPAGKYTLVYDVKTADDSQSGLIGSAALGSYDGTNFQEELSTSVSANEIRGRNVINVQFEAPTTKLIRVKNGPYTTVIEDYQLGVFAEDSNFGIPFLVNSPEILPLPIGQSVTSPLLGVDKDFYKDRDVYFRVRLPEGDFKLDVQWSGSQPQEFACIRAVHSYDMQGVHKSTLESLSSEKQCQLKLQTADETEFLLKVRAAARQEKVVVKIVPMQ